jgi:hypothetical protein
MLFLVGLAPFTVDVLYGATTITTAIAVLAEIFSYGFAALLTRAVAARRRDGSFLVILVLGVAFALAAEFLVVQTSLAPLGVLEPYPDYGRAAGVNWLYLLWALGYESLWGIAIPIALTDLTFPLHRTSAWLGARGCAALTILLVLGAAADWYNWTQLVVPDFLHEAVYLPPLTTVFCGWVVVLVLVLAALLLRTVQRTRPPRSADSAPAPVVVGIAAGGCALVWFALTTSWPMLGEWARAVPAFVPLLLALLFAAACALVGRRWTRAAEWSDRHRLAAITGALIASMAAGFVTNDLSDPVNLIGKIVLNAAAIGALVLLHRKVRGVDFSAAE